MPTKILMPALSPTMEHGNLAKWLKKEGDTIKAGEVIAEIETDKATMEVEAVDEGILAKILIPQGAQEVPVNTLIAILIEDNENESVLAEFIAKEASANSVAAEDNSDKKQLLPAVLNNTHNSQPMQTPLATSSGRVFASPLARRVAAIDGVSLANIRGSGPHGRIVKADIVSSGQVKGKVFRHAEEFRLLPNNNMRKIIAKRLLESKLTVPHFYLSIDCMMDALLEARVQVNNTLGEDKNKKLSVNDFVILAAAKALKDVPAANASWSDEAIKIYNNVDISIAVAIDGGLITPLIRNADQKDIIKISTEMKDLAKRARENSLKPEEFQGGGFSISNLGMYGIKSFNAIVNPPQGCILAVGMSSKRAVVVENRIEIGTVMDVSLSCDHRVVDGAVGAQFLAAFKKYIESPILMFI
jgi:pyruvate dehydrogenase E2 component (dihydrolipoamide acetyltransferase)